MLERGYSDDVVWFVDVASRVAEIAKQSLLFNMMILVASLAWPLKLFQRLRRIVANFTSLMASKSWTPPPTRLVV